MGFLEADAEAFHEGQMSFAQERCPTCGVTPNWHPVWRREVVKAIEAGKRFAPDDPHGVTIVWRLLYRHEPQRVCSRFNKAYDFAPLSVAPPLDPTPAAPPAYERGDAWEGDEAT